MKHLMVLGLTASVVALASCSSDELIQAPSSAGATPIAFNGVAVNKSTRSNTNEITGTSIKDLYINGWVDAAKDGKLDVSSILTKELVQKKAVEKTTDGSGAPAKSRSSEGGEEETQYTWNYSNLQYWTDGDYYFSAIAPASVLDGDNPQVTDFDNVVPTLASNSDSALETDNLYGTFSFDNSGTEYSGEVNALADADATSTSKVESLNTPLDIDLVYASAVEEGAGDRTTEVSLTFNHLLSRVAFQFTNGFSNNNTKLAIKNIIIYDVATSAKVTIPTKAWSEHSTTHQNLLFGNVDKIITSNAANAQNSESDNSTEVSNVRTSENYYLIPYTDAAKGYTVTFDIEQYTDDNLIATYHEITTLPEVTMAAGNSYLYTLYLDPSTIGLKAIKFGVEVNGWETYTEEAVSNYTKTSDSSNVSDEQKDDNGGEEQ